MSIPNFTLTNADRDLVRQIADRAIAQRAQGRDLDGVLRTKMDLLMDLATVHNSNPLRLAELLAAPDFDFVHDIDGITRHLDRKTGALRDFFSPRYSA